MKPAHTIDADVDRERCDGCGKDFRIEVMQEVDGDFLCPKCVKKNEDEK